MLQDFIKKYDGQGIDFDGSFGNQCVDLYRQYVKEVVKAPQSPSVVGAKDIWNNYLSQYFDRVENTPSAVPRSGDIVIWGDKIGEFGHVAIFIEGNAVKFKSFDQNFPVGTKCHVQEHTYKGVLGWLAPKPSATENESNYKWLEQMFIERGIDITKGESFSRGKVQDIFDDAKKSSEQEQYIISVEKELVGAREEAGSWEARYDLADSGRKRAEEEAGKNLIRANGLQRDLDNASRLIDQLQKQEPQFRYIYLEKEYQKILESKKLNLLIAIGGVK